MVRPIVAGGVMFLMVGVATTVQSFGPRRIPDARKRAVPDPSVRYSSSSAKIISQRVATSISASMDADDADDDDDLRFEFVHLDQVDRVFCISDLHVDHADNMEWLANRTTSEYSPDGFAHELTVFGPSDLLVVAGDISHDLDRVEQSLKFLVRTGAHIVFVAGNHEAWLTTKEIEQSKQGGTASSPSSSVDKLDAVYELCRQLGVHTACVKIGGTRERPHTLWLAPLQSWYDGSLSLVGCEDLCEDFGKWPWVDFMRCRWPGYESMSAPNQKIPKGIAEYFAVQNEPLLQGLSEWILRNNNTNTNNHHTNNNNQEEDDTTTSYSRQEAVMTISHFLPNQQCLPDWKDINSLQFDREHWLGHGGGGVSAKFAKVAGTQLLDDQIRGLTLPDHYRQLHVFGHSHRPKDFELEGIRYIHNPLGKPREREIYMVAPDIDFQLVWDTTNEGEVPGKTVIRLWEEQGGGVEALLTRMDNSKRKSRYGKHLKRRMEEERKQ